MFRCKFLQICRRSSFKTDFLICNQPYPIRSVSFSVKASGKEAIITSNKSNVYEKESERDFLARIIDNPDSFGAPANNANVYKRNVATNVQPYQNKLEKSRFPVRLKNDPADSFGSPVREEALDEGDLEEEKHFTEQPMPEHKLSIKEYAETIKGLIAKRQIKEALDVLEVKMLKEDRVKPNNYIYNLLLGACGRVGYTKKAFSLYNDMKRRGLNVTGGTYTALFNACSNSPWPEDGLTRANHLRKLMIEKMYEPNDSNYNAMIKAFGHCGDLETAFSIADEMWRKKFKLKDDTMNFLLQACITDKNAGFRHALLVWQKMVKYRIKPSVYTFNLMLRTVRNCGLGDVKATQDVLDRMLNETRLIEAKETKLIQQPLKYGIVEPANEAVVENLNNNEKLDNNLVDYDEKLRPNLMATVPNLGNIISVSEVKNSEDRLLLVGGMQGFLQNMEKYECKPDIKTLTQLLDCIPSNVDSEKDLLKKMEQLKIKPDLDFLNMLIKKRSMRFDYEGAKEILRLIHKFHYVPDLITYGVLALGCKTREQALELIEEMQMKSYSLNAEILGAMLHQACFHGNIPYVLEIMDIVKREEVNPNTKFMERLKEFKRKYKQISNDYKNPLAKSRKFQKEFRIFQKSYKTWVQEVKIDEMEGGHPWQQYRQKSGTSFKYYKDKSARFKPRHTSRFKEKTSTKVRY